MTELIKYITKIICIIIFLSISLWEIFIVSYCQLKYILLLSDNNAYNFIVACFIINIINCLSLIIQNLRINSCIILFICNMIIGLWSISLYKTNIIFVLFYDVIIVELIFFYTKSIIIGIILIIYLYQIKMSKQDTILEPLLNN